MAAIVNPYLFYGGNCAAAFTRYQEVFGGRLEILRTADLPASEDAPTDDPDMVMHAALFVGDRIIMGSDDPSGGWTGIAGVCVHVAFDDPGEVDRVWEALSEGGTISIPLGQAFWAAKFGSCIDRFGTPWMISTND